MRLVASAPFPVVSLGALSIVAALTATTPVESIPVPDNVASSPEPIAYRDHVAHHSVWEGTYVCAQGLSSLKLTIDVNTLGVATVRYDFGPVPSNPTIPETGAFLLVGSMEPAGGGFTGEFDPTQWIVHPSNYLMLPLSIATDDGVHLRGTIHHDSCSQFQAMRTE